MNSLNGNKRMNIDKKEYLFAFDSHVHFYPVSRPDAILDAAWKNTRQQQLLPIPEGNPHNQDYLISAIGWVRTKSEIDLIDYLQGSNANGCQWTYDEEHDLEYAFRLTRNETDYLWVYRGSQIVTKENIEVLVFGDNLNSPEPKTVALSEYLASMVDSHMAILPWGVGKWFGERGKLIERCLQAYVGQPLFLGDNSSRPECWRNISAFELADKLSTKILPGTDPLPLSNQEQIVGTSGVTLGLSETIPPSPAKLGLKLLDMPDGQTYRLAESALGCLKNQIKLRLA